MPTTYNAKTEITISVSIYVLVHLLNNKITPANLRLNS